MLEIIVWYIVGTLFGYLAFRNINRESIITTTLDTLIDDDYVRSYEDSDGKIHLYKWYELDDLLEGAKIKINGEEIEKDDTP